MIYQGNFGISSLLLSTFSIMEVCSELTQGDDNSKNELDVLAELPHIKAVVKQVEEMRINITPYVKQPVGRIYFGEKDLCVAFAFNQDENSVFIVAYRQSLGENQNFSIGTISAKPNEETTRLMASLVENIIDTYMKN